jgi:hypothetical protein
MSSALASVVVLLVRNTSGIETWRSHNAFERVDFKAQCPYRNF